MELYLIRGLCSLDSDPDLAVHWCKLGGSPMRWGGLECCKTEVRRSTSLTVCEGNISVLCGHLQIWGLWASGAWVLQHPWASVSKYSTRYQVTPQYFWKSASKRLWDEDQTVALIQDSVNCSARKIQKDLSVLEPSNAPTCSVRNVLPPTSGQRKEVDRVYLQDHFF